jgi:hypothetical protein
MALSRTPVVLLLLAACAASPRRVAAPVVPGAEVQLVRDPASDVFAIATRGGDGKSLRPTSLLGGLDAQVVERLVRTRMKKAMGEALRDLFTTLLGDTARSRPAQDLLHALEALVLQVSDGEGRSQTLTSSLVRVGLSYGIALLSEKDVLPKLGCVSLDDRATSAYEALATSTYVSPLGFTAATGTVPKECLAFAQHVARLVDTTVALGMSGGKLAAVVGDVKRVRASCTVTVRAHLGPELRDALRSLGDEVTALDLSIVDDLRATFERSAATFDKEVTLLQAEIDQCYGALRALAQDVDAVGAVVALVAGREGISAERLLGQLAGVLADTLGFDVPIDPALVDMLLQGAGAVAQIKTAAVAVGRCAEKEDASLWSMAGSCLDGKVGKCATECTALVTAAAPILRPLEEAVERSVLGDVAPLVAAARELHRCADNKDPLDVAKLPKVLASVANKPECQAIARGFRFQSQSLDEGRRKTFAAAVALDELASCLKVHDRSPAALIALALDGECRDEAASLAGKLRVVAEEVVGVRVDKLLAIAGKLQAVVAQLQPLRGLITALVEKRLLVRADVVQLAGFVGELVGRLPPGVGKDVLAAVVELVPQAIREDKTTSLGMRLDVPALATTLVTRYSERDTSPIYLRATVGMGYMYGSETPAGVSPSFHEEIGIGYRRVIDRRLTLGVHAIVSGLLYNLASAAATEDSIFVGLGVSANLYKAIEVSLNAGGLFALGDGPGKQLAFTFSLQLPLIDYILAIAGDGDMTATESTSP